MIKLNKQKNKKIGIYGLGITGSSVFQALSLVTENIICFDDQEKNILSIPEKNIANLEDERWKDLDFIVLSPGIPLTYPSPHPIVSLAKKNDIPIFSDLDLLYEEYPNAIYIGVTGTNGKSTTSALLYHLLQDHTIYFQLGGNIGKACLDLNPIEDSTNYGFILELSSFQLDLISKLKLDYACITNITADHLDRHGSLEEYINAKKKIFLIGKPNFDGFINQDDKTLAKINFENKITRSSITNLNPIIKNHKNPFLQGAHNLENICIACNIATSLCLSDETITSKISSFKGLPHRMEFINRINHNKFSISFYNDSKATNLESALKSISSLENIFLLAGGIAKKGEDLSRIKEFAEKIRKIYVFGRDKDIFTSALENFIPIQLCDNMEQAFNFALSDAKKFELNSNILLAPACASTDQFKNFEDRGEQFRSLVTNLFQ